MHGYRGLYYFVNSIDIVSIIIELSLLIDYNSIMIESKIIDLKQLSQQFKALGDPSRLQILALLANNQHCVCDLQSSIGIPANLLSHHLKVLKEAGLVQATKRGRWVDYKLNGNAIELLKTALPPTLELAEIDDLMACESVKI